MNKAKLKFISIPILFIIFLSACNLPGNTPTDPQQTADILTAVAQTVAAESGQLDPVTEEAPEITVTEDPGQTEASEAPPSDTPEPSDTPAPSETPIPCNLAEFVKDVNIPDGKVFKPGASFTKTWRLKNVGSCAWTSGYNVIFDGGDAMGAASEVAVTGGTVNPGEAVDVSVDLTAPSSGGTYRGNWKLKDPSGVVFGVDNSSSGFFWVEIKVVEPSPTPTKTNTPFLIITLKPPVITIVPFPFITPSSP